MVTIFLSILFGIFLGLAMSVDAFMLSLVYGLTIERRREAFYTGIIVGIFHFFMPLIGYFITYFLLSNIITLSVVKTQFNHLGSFILLILGMFMIYKKEEGEKRDTFKNFLSKILFAFSVSLDSFFIGIALTSNDRINIFLIALIFFCVSSSITYSAIRLIHRTKKLLSFNKLNVIAGIILMIFAFISLFLT